MTVPGKNQRWSSGRCGISLTWFHVSTMQEFPAELDTPSSLCSQQKQTLLGHDSSALFPTSVINYNRLQSLHNRVPQPTVPKYIVLGDVPLVHQPPMWLLLRLTVGASLVPWEGTKCLQAPRASHFCFIKAVIPETSWDLSLNTSCAFPKVVKIQLRIDRGGYSAFWDPL